MKGLLDDDNWVDSAKSDKHMDKLGLSYVFCAGVSKDELRSVFLCREISSPFICGEECAIQ